MSAVCMYIYDRLLPGTLNMLVILKHKSFWHAESSIQEIFDSNNFRHPEQEPETEKEEDL